MAPTRNSRSVNKRFSHINKVSHTEDGESANRNSPRKRKISDILGPQWSKEELTHFYDAYRKHGKDWKKVAAAVRNRTIDMVEALYTMNRAYLSLPEGTASVVGLIAMMTDYYCNLAGSDSDQESNDGAGTSRKPQKRARGKVQPSTLKASDGNLLSPPQNVASAYGCLSLLMKKCPEGSRPRAVGKRTPRFPVSYSYENFNGDKYFSPTRQGLKMKGNANDDEVAHKIASALAEASHRVSSPQVLRTPNKKTESVMSSAVRKGERKYFELETARSKPAGSDMDEEDLEGSMEADTGELSRYRAHQMESGSVGKLLQTARRYSGKKLEVDESIENQLDETKEACSRTEESQRFGAGRGKFETEVTDVKILRSPLQVSRKRSKKLLFSKDDEFLVDALHALADVSLGMLGPEKNESPLQVKDELDESGLQEAMPRSHLRDSRKSSTVKVKASQAISRFEVVSPKTLKVGKVSVCDDSAEPEGKMEYNQSTLKAIRKKPKAVASKIHKTEARVDINLSESQEVEARDTGNTSISKFNRSSQSTSPTSAKNHEDSSCNDPRREGSDSAQSTAQVSVVNQVSLPTKVRSRRKMDLKKPQMQKDLRFPENNSGDHTNAPLSSLHDRTFSCKQMLSSSLSNYRARRWCIFEWFYSAIDYPWFAKREFVEYLYHVGLGHVPRLTRVEWGVIRSSLGKPRRFSEQFLKEEKEKLNQYRDSVRIHYSELREGIREGLPTDLARPLSVGQRVVAIHPKTREIHDGSVLTVDRSRCRVQFDRPELGVEFVTDIDCMPLNAFENMPTSLARRNVAVDKFFENLNELNLNGQVKDFVRCAPGDALENVNGLPHLSPSVYGIGVLSQTKVAAADANIQARLGSSEAATYQQTSYSQPSKQAQIQAKDADVEALTELTRALDKKEAVVVELRRMNDDVTENQKVGNSSLKDSEPFQKQYAAVLVQLHEANDQVSSALYCLRQRNTYQGHIPLTWPRPNSNLVDPAGFINSVDIPASQFQESASHVNEIIQSSKTKARTMVDVAMQAMSSLKVSENTDEKIVEAIDYVNDRLPLDDSCIPPTSDPKSITASEGKEAEIPSELISHCVATLLMIQKCTERQFPPADVAQILDSAVMGLQPCCSQNLPFYAEIQKCMGIIRNQILALVPT